MENTAYYGRVKILPSLDFVFLKITTPLQVFNPTLTMLSLTNGDLYNHYK